jgi:hypothetical protein
MPYIITTTTPDPANTKDYGRFGDPVPNAPTAMGAVRGCWPPRVTRTAVATLDEARKHITRNAPQDLRKRVAALDQSGGTVGPLPDGTVIEVRPVMHVELAREAGLGRRDTPMMSDAAILAAFNAS